jgi:hypothetical protein
MVAFSVESITREGMIVRHIELGLLVPLALVLGMFLNRPEPIMKLARQTLDRDIELARLKSANSMHLFIQAPTFADFRHNELDLPRFILFSINTT